MVELDESPDVGITEDHEPPEFITDPMQRNEQPVEGEPKEFITDPMQRNEQPVESEPPEFISGPVQPGEQPVEGEPKEDSSEFAADGGPVVTERKTEREVEEITVPVVISRSQVRKTIALKLRLDIRVIDD